MKGQNRKEKKGTGKDQESKWNERKGERNEKEMKGKEK